MVSLICQACAEYFGMKYTETWYYTIEIPAEGYFLKEFLQICF